MLLLVLSFSSASLPSRKAHPLSGKSQGFPTPCCISYLHTCASACCLLRKGEKQNAEKSNLLLLEVYSDSLELWGRHQKLIVLEGVACLHPFPNLISRLCNEVRIRATLKTGRRRKTPSPIQFCNFQGAFLPVSLRSHQFY